ncbi:MAG TPA: hypothetical protein P5081_22460 [Phycisphaerae bacterium]|nr:hypothetical protein [Phycisphaerae bacterium]HRW55645.1 hypothetical protein [Phycisphaerae bacterium]
MSLSGGSWDQRCAATLIAAGAFVVARALNRNWSILSARADDFNAMSMHTTNTAMNATQRAALVDGDSNTIIAFSQQFRRNSKLKKYS